MDLDRPELEKILKGRHPLWVVRGGIRSGKTGILTRAAAHLAEQGKRVLCVCASPSAGEVVRRETSKASAAHNPVRVYTPIRLSRELLSRSGQGDTRLLGPFHRWLILKLFVKNRERYPAADIAFGSVVSRWMDLIALLKGYEIPCRDVKVDGKDAFFVHLKNLYEDYGALLGRRGDWLDFEDERLRVCRLLGSEGAGEMLAGTFGPDLPDLVLLEDAGELTRLDARLIGAFLKALRDLARPRLKVLIAVGTSGSLLRFRGGSPRNLEHLLPCLAPWKPRRLDLEGTGRSRAKQRPGIEAVLTEESRRKQIVAAPFKRDGEEAEFVCRAIQELVAEQGYAYECLASSTLPRQRQLFLPIPIVLIQCSIRGGHEERRTQRRGSSRQDWGQVSRRSFRH